MIKKFIQFQLSYSYLFVLVISYYIIIIILNSFSLNLINFLSDVIMAHSTNITQSDLIDLLQTSPNLPRASSQLLPDGNENLLDHELQSFDQKVSKACLNERTNKSIATVDVEDILINLDDTPLTPKNFSFNPLRRRSSSDELLDAMAGCASNFQSNDRSTKFCGDYSKKDEEEDERFKVEEYLRDLDDYLQNIDSGEDVRMGKSEDSLENSSDEVN